ncbi:MAG TPA: ATPase domain-containing protein, partial [Roseiflexaceae bacterium]|nr:ATPase domain-containing protein [Roseiflexaceae bacterium]
GVTHPALVVIIGNPGAGKTILASQIIFNAASQGTKTLVFTTFSEGNTQYIQHLQTLAFFDEASLGDTLQVFSLASVMTEQDSSAAAAIARIIRVSGAKLVLLDGFQGAVSLGLGEHDMRLLLAELSNRIRYLDATILVTIAGATRNSHFNEQLTVADIAIGLDYSVEGRRHQRLLEIAKLRGRAQWPGLHSYAITGAGVEIFPRLESYPLTQVHQNTDTRVPFHLPELDQLMEGGPNTATTTLLAGAPGVGKTTLGLHWAVAEARPDATSVFLSFAEHQEQLERKAAAFGLDLRAAIASSSVRVVRMSSADLNPDRVAQIIMGELRSGAVRRLVIDDIAVLLHELGERTRDYLSALNDIVYNANISSMYLLEITPFDGLRVNLTNTPLASLGDNIIVVQQYEITGLLRRLLAVLRMRLSFFDRTLRELVLDETGIRILSPEATEAGLLAAGAHMSGGVAPGQAERDNVVAPATAEHGKGTS